MALQVSVIIINYKTPKLTTECIESILQHTQWVNYEIILVDNGSWSESKEYFTQYMPKDTRVRIIYSPHNVWFWWGNNVWYANCTWDYIFFLNSDTLLYEDSLTILYNEYNKLSNTYKLWLLWPRLYHDKEKTKVQIAWTNKVTLWKVIICSVPYLNILFSTTYKKFVYNIDRNKSQWLSAICWAAFFVARHIWDELGQFDEQFFLYMEEFDLAMRTQKLWYENYYTVSTSIIHLENQSPKITWRKRYFSTQSLLKLLWKYKRYLFLSNN